MPPPRARALCCVLSLAALAAWAALGGGGESAEPSTAAATVQGGAGTPVPQPVSAPLAAAIHEDALCSAAPLLLDATAPSNTTEKRCSDCRDMCGLKLPGGRSAMEAVALRVTGAGAVSTWGNCHGSYDYGGQASAFHTFVVEADGCVALSKPTILAHIRFHGLPGQPPLPHRAPGPAGEAVDGEAAVRRVLRYWERAAPRAEGTPSAAPGKYVTFYQDCGGFNNIRMGFEHAVLMAWTTGRTLVLPTPSPWYLIDYGPFHAGRPGDGDVTDYAEFFNVALLRKNMPGGVLTVKEFLAREGEGLMRGFSAMGRTGKGFSQAFHVFVSDKFGIAPPCAPTDKVWLDPSQEVFEREGPDWAKALVGGRGVREFDSGLRERPIIDFAGCMIDGAARDRHRTLGQIAATVLFADSERDLAFRHFWKSSIVLAEDIFDTASKVVAQLGLWRYSSLHIRRNDLQYKDAFISAADTLRHVEPLLREGEPLYIATDEMSPDFFAVLSKGRQVHRWTDFYDAARGVLRGSGHPVRRKVINCIEQIICAGGRRFFGTHHSTYTSYIFRLRGYMGAPDTAMRWHNIRYLGAPALDAIAEPPVAGREYMNELRRMWELV